MTCVNPSAPGRALSRRGALPGLTLLLLLLLLFAAPADAQTDCQGGRGGSIYANGGEVTVQILPGNPAAIFTSQIRLQSPAPVQTIGSNTQVGTTVSLGTFPAGTELVFDILVNDSIQPGLFTYSTGPGSRNPDGVAHADVLCLGGGVAQVSFEDGFGAGDNSYNDVRFEVRQPLATGVAKLQYQSDQGFVDAQGTLYVPEGTSLTFKAVPDPAGAGWPAGKPAWGGTAGATGSGGDTRTVAFNTASKNLRDVRTVTAENNNTVTVNVVVYALTGELVPQDNFRGRSDVRYGINEQVNLSVTIKPAVTPAQAGGLQWRVVGGGGSTTSGFDGKSVYTAAETPGAVTLKLEITSGPSKSQGPTFDRTIVAPESAYMRQKPQTKIYHTQGLCSVGFMGEAFLQPNDVSFGRILFLEGEAFGIGIGYYAGINGLKHEFGLPNPVTGCNTRTGCKAFEDIVQTEDGPPFADGEFTWPIPWMYVIGTGTPSAFYTANHHQLSDATGKATIEKAGAGPFTKLSTDRTTYY
jgi:hypothetical protein